MARRPYPVRSFGTAAALIGVLVVIHAVLLPISPVTQAANGASLDAFPKKIFFGDVQARSKSPKSDLLIVNAGDEKVKVSLSVVGADASDFSVKPRGKALNAGQYRAFGVFFKPKTEGIKEAQISVNDGELLIPVTGQGIDKAKPPTVSGWAAKPKKSLTGIAQRFQWKSAKGSAAFHRCGIVFDASEEESMETLTQRLFSEGALESAIRPYYDGDGGGDGTFSSPWWDLFSFYYTPRDTCGSGNIKFPYDTRGFKSVIFGVQDASNLTALRTVVVEIRSPDFTVSWVEHPSVKSKGGKFEIQGKVLVDNIGDPLDKKRKVEVLIEWPDGDETTKKIKLNKSKILKLKKKSSEDPAGQILTVEVDPDDDYLENDEGNNDADSDPVS